jgi:type VII secretion integral membrane protein EccD
MVSSSIADGSPIVDDRLRVAINIPGHIVDLSLVSKVPIAHVVSHLIPYLRQQLASNGKAVEFLNSPDAAWHLERFGHVSLDPEKTLEQEGMLDGDSLYLVPTSPGENYPALIDDVAESIAYNQNRNFPTWNNDHAIKLSLAAFQLVTVVIIGIATWWTVTTMPDPEVRYGIVGSLLIIALGMMAMVVTVTKSESNRLNRVTGPLSVVGYITLSDAAFIVIPREPGIHQLVTVSAALFAAALFMYSATRDHARLHYTVSTASLIALLVLGVNLAYLSPPSVIGVQMILVALSVILISSRVSMPFAKIIVPYVPATGEPYLKDDPHDISTVGRTPGSPGSPGSSQAVESIINQEEQVLTAYNVIDGLISGSLLVMMVSALFTGLYLDNHHWIIWSFILVVSACLAYRGKSYSDARRQALCLSGTAGMMVLFTVGLLFSPAYAYNQERVSINVAIIVLGMVVATVFAVQQRRINSPIVMKMFEYVEMFLFSSLLVYLMLVMDLYQKVRAR